MNWSCPDCGNLNIKFNVFCENLSCDFSRNIFQWLIGSETGLLSLFCSMIAIGLLIWVIRCKKQ